MMKQNYHVLIYFCCIFQQIRKKRRFYLFTICIFAYLCIE